ncbi:MAG: hypothetical protein ACE5HQ_05435 [Gemmatimonadota bacterium]
MKLCRSCESRIPDHAKHCPHCRVPQRRVDWMPQALLVAASAAVAIAVLLQGCPKIPS